MSSPITPEVAKTFFASLYKDEPSLTHDSSFDKMATRLVTSLSGRTATGDHALQALMLNHILSSPENVAKGTKLTTYVANIKAALVGEFTKTFPTANLDELIAQAKHAGYDVEVLRS
jgi:hypothetical protein